MEIYNEKWIEIMKHMLDEMFFTDAPHSEDDVKRYIRCDYFTLEEFNGKDYVWYLDVDGVEMVCDINGNEYNSSEIGLYV